mgnify:CR=1 FL=1
MAEIIGLFPIPIMSNEFGRGFTEAELNIIHGCRNKTIRTGGEGTSNEVSFENRILDNPGLSDIRRFIEENINLYVDNVEVPNPKFETYITHSFVTFTERGKEHKKHLHSNSFISGILYISAERETDQICFYNNNYAHVNKFPDFEKDSNQYNCSCWYMPVYTGRLLIFPSNIEHSVSVLESDHTRISLVFNTFIRGDIGVKMTLNDLSLR